MKKIEILAPAKINLFLKILNKRRDGYHNIETVFEKISLFDKLSIKELPQNEIIIESDSKALSGLGKDNIIYKTADLVKRKFRIKKGVHIFLEKRIPIAAGLAGGSSDAAASLKGINRLWNLGLSHKDLFSLSENIGSDVVLFIAKGSFLLGKERGQQLYALKGTQALKLWHILVIPDFGISTAYAYALFDRHANSYGKLNLTIPNYSANIITYALSNRDVSLLNYYSYNSFESVIFRRFLKLARLKARLEARVKDFFHLSGSGPSLFITLSSRKEAEHLSRRISEIRHEAGVNYLLIEGGINDGD